MVLIKCFNSQSISVNLIDENIETIVHLFLNEKDLIIEKSTDIVPLNNQELLRLSMSLNPKKLKDYFQSVTSFGKLFPSRYLDRSNLLQASLVLETNLCTN